MWQLMTVADQVNSVALLFEVEKKVGSAVKISILAEQELLAEDHRIVFFFDQNGKRMRCLDLTHRHNGTPEYARRFRWIIAVGSTASERRIVQWAEMIAAIFTRYADQRIATGQCPWGERRGIKASRLASNQRRRHFVGLVPLPHRIGFKSEGLA